MRYYPYCLYNVRPCLSFSTARPCRTCTSCYNHIRNHTNFDSLLQDPKETPNLWYIKKLFERKKQNKTTPHEYLNMVLFISNIISWNLNSVIPRNVKEKKKKNAVIALEINTSSVARVFLLFIFCENYSYLIKYERWNHSISGFSGYIFFSRYTIGAQEICLSFHGGILSLDFSKKKKPIFNHLNPSYRLVPCTGLKLNYYIMELTIWIYKRNYYLIFAPLYGSWSRTMDDVHVD